MAKKKKGKMTKRPSILVLAPGCEGCGHVCRYNCAVCDPFMAAEWKREFPYGCNSKIQSFEIEEGADNHI